MLAAIANLFKSKSKMVLRGPSAQIYNLIENGPITGLTTKQIANNLALNYNSVRGRMAELHRLKVVEKGTGKRWITRNHAK